MHPHHHSNHENHHGPGTKSWWMTAIFLFILFNVFSSGNWWLIFFLFPLFSMIKSNRASWCGWDNDSSDGKPKNDDKPKRRVVETADGEYLEVIEPPRSV